MFVVKDSLHERAIFCPNMSTCSFSAFIQITTYAETESLELNPLHPPEWHVRQVISSGIPCTPHYNLIPVQPALYWETVPVAQERLTAMVTYNSWENSIFFTTINYSLHFKIYIFMFRIVYFKCICYLSMLQSAVYHSRKSTMSSAAKTSTRRSVFILSYLQYFNCGYSLDVGFNPTLSLPPCTVASSSECRAQSPWSL